MSERRRKICYVSGTRADFGLMQATLQAIASDSGLDLDVVATGMHLSQRFGMTVDEIVASGLTVAERIPVDIEVATGAAMARNLAKTLSGCVAAFERLGPDLVLLLGDRGEMLAAALAAIHLNIPVAHIHGGERSGTVDEPVRHAISKLSHYHFVTSENARQRLVRMGEREEHVFVTGAPGLDGVRELASLDRATLCSEVDFDPNGKLALLVYHPVLQEADNAPDQAKALIEACLSRNIQLIALMPNSDAGSEGVRKVLDAFSGHPKVRVRTHLPRQVFISWMASSDLMIGNSSSGIIEAASFGTPVINVGLRQNLRERNLNVIDSPPEIRAVSAAIDSAMKHGRYPIENIYGDGQAGRRIVELLRSLELKGDVLLKTNTY
ncbi:GDP/UDP-N,N'-diacetylbacillosamine 2-epimerase (hydrolysing) [Sulfuritortus calidifontis]|uniref:GDP/UDP-N,N'-diacetylbacillosamine 2-epimerase (Hydrolysing) n=1 Tax=Sulfuritortus calidifontis TaxID=1914471 RepID=A0A4R3JW84_9PROT|nr:UDP-N-acetylglucosamine 2-epimerase [Sulfuritortus calidifontis]TCS72474.1 GDP/UDP-N,N'-diacetylbacillosamine 2-epimerase (hydrolysing) [Sulfuritortus calidifontis]